MRERLQSHLVTLKQGMMRNTATNAEPGRMSYKMWRDEKRQRETLAEMHMQTPAAPSTSRPEDVRGS